MIAEAKLMTPNEAPMSVTLRGTLGEFEDLASAVRKTDIPFWQVRALLDAIADASRKLRAGVRADVKDQP